MTGYSPNKKIFFLIKIILFYLILSSKCYSDSSDANNNLVVLGHNKAIVKIKIFSSLTCPHCANFHNEVVPEIKKQYIDLSHHSHLKKLFSKGKDINFDGIDDLIMVNQQNEFSSNIWGNKKISLPDSQIINFFINLDEGISSDNFTSENNLIIFTSVFTFNAS